VETRYITDETGERVGVILSIEEYERLREIEDALEDVRRFDAAMEAIERGEADLVPWEEAKREIEAEREELRRRGAI
jgi:PHD/YefM family antitoxin component YafN of YafNO toxin-antitoxin module